MWFDASHAPARYAAQLEFLASLSPDVVCLQEVTQPYLDLLQAQRATLPWLAGYTLNSPTFHGSFYGTAMLVRTALAPDFSRHPFSGTEMARDLTLCRLVAPGGTAVVVGNTHLESMNTASERAAQLEECRALLAAQGLPAILAGDFNFCALWDYAPMQQALGVPAPRAFVLSPLTAAGGAAVQPSSPLPPQPQQPQQPAATASENASLQRTLPDFTDAWPALHGPCTLDNPGGFTFDSCSNPMIDRPERMRYDRVLFRLPSAFALTQCSVLGRSPIGQPAAEGDGTSTPKRAGPPVLLSDHFPLLAVWQVSV